MSLKIITGSTGSTHVTSNNDGEFNQSIWGDDLVVLSNGNKLAATIADNNTITISDGDLVLQGRHALLEPGTTEDVTIETGSVGKNRKDLIVAHYEIDTTTGYESITFAVIKGDETTGTPTAPSYTTGVIRTGSTIVEAPLYEVLIENVAISSVTAQFEIEDSVNDQLSSLRSNLVGLIKIGASTNSSAVTVSANSASSIVCKPETIDGYTVIGVIRFFVGSNHLIPYSVGIGGVQLQNATSSAITVSAGTMLVTYIYIKNGFI